MSWLALIWDMRSSSASSALVLCMRTPITEVRYILDRDINKRDHMRHQPLDEIKPHPSPSLKHPICARLPSIKHLVVADEVVSVEVEEVFVLRIFQLCLDFIGQVCINPADTIWPTEDFHSAHVEIIRDKRLLSKKAWVFKSLSEEIISKCFVDDSFSVVEKVLVDRQASRTSRKQARNRRAR